MDEVMYKILRILNVRRKLSAAVLQSGNVYDTRELVNMKHNLNSIIVQKPLINCCLFVFSLFAQPEKLVGRQI